MSTVESLYRLLLAGLMLSGMGITSANAALVTSIDGLDIDGTKYDVLFHQHVLSSFNDLWDGNGDGDFGDGSLTGQTPTFWEDPDGAEAAAAAIIAALNPDHHTSVYSLPPFVPTTFSDLFFIPTVCNTDRLCAYGDINDLLDMDEIGFTTLNRSETVPLPLSVFASFTEVSPVPVPAAFWLFGSALIGLVGFNRRKARISA